MSAKPRLQLLPAERRISLAMSGLYAVRMLGLFLLLPVFAVTARHLPGGDSAAHIGLALGIYGLTQACLQLPFGFASDRWGRRPVVLFGLLLYIVGSIVCALSHDLFWITIGRAVQGSGAISAAISAWLADSTRPEVRTRAMAMVGSSIGIAFAVSLIVAPILVGWIGLSGLFWVITALGAICFVVAACGVPVPQREAGPAMGTGTHPVQVLAHGDLLRLNVGVFCLHLIQVALFVVVPSILLRLGSIPASDLWHVYLPVIFISFVLMVPVVIVTEKRRAHRGSMIVCVAGIALACALMYVTRGSFYGLAAVLVLFFVVFNVLEALQPSLVSRVAPPEYKGLALGFYNTCQALGLFAGGVLGGWLSAHGGPGQVFLLAAAVAVFWLLVTRTLKPLA